MVAEREEAAEAALDAYGRNLGIAFQLVDDAIDYSSDAATMGKRVGDDLRDGKVTLPVILAYARGSEADRAFWREAIAGGGVEPDLARATDLLEATGALADTLERARLFGRRAIDALGAVPGRTGQGGPGRDRRVRDPAGLLTQPLSAFFGDEGQQGDLKRIEFRLGREARLQPVGLGRLDRARSGLKRVAVRGLRGGLGGGREA